MYQIHKCPKGFQVKLDNNFCGTFATEAEAKQAVAAEVSPINPVQYQTALIDNRTQQYVDGKKVPPYVLPGGSVYGFKEDLPWQWQGWAG